MPYLNVVFNRPLKSSYTYSTEKDVSVPLGCRVKASLGNRVLTGWVVGHSSDLPQGVRRIKKIEEILDTEPLFGLTFLNLAHWLAAFTLCSLGEALAAMLPGAQRESSLVELEDSKIDSFLPHKITDEQKMALNRIISTENDWFYLYGSTGSGKTEVFLRAAENTLAQERSVIYLVPEIALSHQLVELLQARFKGNIVAVMHSGLSPRQRLGEWRRIQRNEARLILGARTAVFAPVNNLGLIILDEEHEGSYKSSSTPRFHARQLAMHRCRQSGARLVMGSATPSVEAWKLMKEEKLQGLTLCSRPAGGALPRVTVVDLRQEKTLFSQNLIEAMNRVLNEGRQVLLFLNRRGFSYRYNCRTCGYALTCRHCSIPLTYHKNIGTMICHYCSFKAPPPHSCPECQSLDIGASGFGTERVEEDVAKFFPERSIARLDTDAVRRKGLLKKTLKKFKEGEIDILLGTQMVAKGLNAPGVKLVGLLLADSTLNLPDFRAAERNFALIIQVAGRAGRFAPDGEVIIQTLQPDAPSIHLAANNAIDAFYTQELEQRRILRFPPYSRLFRLVLRGKNEEQVRKNAEELAAALEGKSDWEILGPAPCPLEKIAGQYRRHIILRTQSFDRSHGILGKILATTKKKVGVNQEIDIDPVSLL